MTRPKQDPIVNGAEVVENGNSFAEQLSEAMVKGRRLLDTQEILDMPIDWLNEVSMPIEQMQEPALRHQLRNCRDAITLLKHQDGSAKAEQVPVVPAYLPRMTFLIDRLKTTATQLHLAHAEDRAGLFPSDRWEEFLWLVEAVTELHDRAIRERAEARKKANAGPLTTIEVERFGLSRDHDPIVVVLESKSQKYHSTHEVKDRVFRFLSSDGVESVARVQKLGCTFDPPGSRSNKMQNKKLRYWYIEVLTGYNPLDAIAEDGEDVDSDE